MAWANLLQRGAAAWAYEAQDEFELTLAKGQRVFILAERQDGWAVVHSDGQAGLVPLNYVRAVEEPGAGAAEALAAPSSDALGAAPQPLQRKRSASALTALLTSEARSAAREHRRRQAKQRGRHRRGVSTFDLGSAALELGSAAPSAADLAPTAPPKRGHRRARSAGGPGAALAPDFAAELQRKKQQAPKPKPAKSGPPPIPADVKAKAAAGADAGAKPKPRVRSWVQRRQGTMTLADLEAKYQLKGGDKQLQTLGRSLFSRQGKLGSVVEDDESSSSDNEPEEQKDEGVAALRARLQSRIPLSPATLAAGDRPLPSQREQHPMAGRPLPPPPADAPEAKEAKEEMPDPPDTPENENHRRLTYQEIAETETAFVNDLRVLESVFITPLQNEVAKGTPVLTPEEIASVFSNVTQLATVNEELQRALVAAVNSPDPAPGVLQAFTDIRPYLRMYSVFCSQYYAALAVVERLSASDPRVNAFFETAARDVRCAGRTLSSFLIKPVQRITKYPLFFKDLLKHTPRARPEYAQLLAAKAAIEDCSNEVNKRMSEAENRDKVVQIYHRLNQTCPDLVAPNRRFLREAAVEVSTTTSQQKKEYVLYLFNDLLLLARPYTGAQSLLHRAETYRLKHRFALDEILVRGADRADRAPDAAGHVSFDIMHISASGRATVDKFTVWCEPAVRAALVEAIEKAKELYLLMSAEVTQRASSRKGSGGAGGSKGLRKWATIGGRTRTRSNS